MDLWILPPTGMGLRSEGGQAAATAQRFHAVKTDSSDAPSWFYLWTAGVLAFAA